MYELNKEDSDTVSEDSDTGNGFTMFTINGKTKYITDKSGTTVIDLPGMRNLQIGSGKIHVVNGRPKTHRRSPPPKDKIPCASSIKSHHKQQSSKLTDSTEKPTRRDISHVCNNMGKQWKKLGRSFGFSKGQIEAIEVDFHIEGNYEMAYQTILKWKRQNGDLVTIQDLAKAIDSIGLTELARELPAK